MPCPAFLVVINSLGWCSDGLGGYRQGGEEAGGVARLLHVGHRHHRRGMEPAQHWEGIGPDTAVAVIEAEAPARGCSGRRLAWAASS